MMVGNALKYLKACESQKELLLMRMMTKDGCYMQSVTY